MSADRAGNRTCRRTQVASESGAAPRVGSVGAYGTLCRVGRPRRLTQTVGIEGGSGTSKSDSLGWSDPEEPRVTLTQFDRNET